MAKLKIPTPDPTKPDGFDHDRPNVQGYVNVVDNLLVQRTYRDFLDADEDDRPDKLQDYASNGGADPTCAVFHEVIASPVNEFKKIDDDNCSIRVEKDKRKRKNKNKPSRFRISFPEGNRLDPPGYLDRYALEIFKLYAQGYGVALPNPLVIQDQNALDRAHKFMFGMMLLTRCR
jgi:hypothetical protein